MNIYNFLIYRTKFEYLLIFAIISYVIILIFFLNDAGFYIYTEIKEKINNMHVTNYNEISSDDSVLKKNIEQQDHYQRQSMNKINVDFYNSFIKLEYNYEINGHSQPRKLFEFFFKDFIFLKNYMILKFKYNNLNIKNKMQIYNQQLPETILYFSSSMHIITEDGFKSSYNQKNYKFSHLIADMICYSIGLNNFHNRIVKVGGDNTVNINFIYYSMYIKPMIEKLNTLSNKIKKDKKQEDKIKEDKNKNMINIRNHFIHFLKLAYIAMHIERVIQSFIYKIIFFIFLFIISIVSQRIYI